MLFCCVFVLFSGMLSFKLTIVSYTGEGVLQPMEKCCSKADTLCKCSAPNGASLALVHVRLSPARHIQEKKSVKLGRKLKLLYAAFILPCEPSCVCSTPRENMHALRSFAWEKEMRDCEPTCCMVKKQHKIAAGSDIC